MNCGLITNSMHYTHLKSCRRSIKQQIACYRGLRDSVLPITFAKTRGFPPVSRTPRASLGCDRTPQLAVSVEENNSSLNTTRQDFNLKKL